MTRSTRGLSTAELFVVCAQRWHVENLAEFHNVGRETC